MIPGGLAILVQPLHKAIQDAIDLVQGEVFHVLPGPFASLSACVATLKASTFRNRTRVPIMAFSFCICSRRWKSINSGDTGLGTLLIAADKNPKPRARPPNTTGGLAMRYPTLKNSQRGLPPR